MTLSHQEQLCSCSVPHLLPCLAHHSLPQGPQKLLPAPRDLSAPAGESSFSSLGDTSVWVANPRYKHAMQYWRHSSRVEAKNPALLSNRDGYLLELTGWTQGSQAS